MNALHALSATVLVLTTGLLAVPTVAEASLRDSISVLEQQVEVLARRGFECREHAMGTVLHDGETEEFELVLHAGAEYVIPGAGDSTTRDLDLEIYDENGNFIDGDDMLDALPFVVVEPAWSGTFTVRMTMASGHGDANFAICFR